MLLSKKENSFSFIVVNLEKQVFLNVHFYCVDTIRQSIIASALTKGLPLMVLK